MYRRLDVAIGPDPVGVEGFRQAVRDQGNAAQPIGLGQGGLAPPRQCQRRAGRELQQPQGLPRLDPGKQEAHLIVPLILPPFALAHHQQGDAPLRPGGNGAEAGLADAGGHRQVRTSPEGLQGADAEGGHRHHHTDAIGETDISDQRAGTSLPRPLPLPWTALGNVGRPLPRLVLLEMLAAGVSGLWSDDISHVQLQGTASHCHGPAPACQSLATASIGLAEVTDGCDRH
ncbi:MAG: hypothetical protein ERJ68_06840 [Aphanocapsa feldmannii 277cI]|uniref:Uncharacterized protein n=1 Tax=Aphanocapsa feldmannii 277cI TaxID=2507554 RepID=A0A524RSM1_9CHRO|nr:MAG: hypothetical protein ERJ68_06840 [Aphanocapsa feldmannii 277cI]